MSKNSLNRRQQTVMLATKAARRSQMRNAGSVRCPLNLTPEVIGEPALSSWEAPGKGLAMVLSSFVLSMGLAACCADRPGPQLRVGIASHAYDHLGAFGEQAEAATASGANILYATGIGGDAYSGLPASFDAAIARAKSYSDRARVLGARRMIGYLCATSIVGLDKFDAHWTREFRARFKAPPSEWLQRDPKNMPLPSWYGGDYRPACMNHPDWREYQRAMVASQLKAGQDGILFDNPTVHNLGCYCDHCMRAFAAFLSSRHQGKAETSLIALRSMAQHEHAREFAVFRTTIARDFLAEMGRFARTIRPDAWITANNSLNSPSVFYSQSKLYGYSIYEMSKAEDFVVVEDMETQPRLLETGKVVEYGPTYRQVSAISHGKPVVAVTIAAGDYHTPARLVRLAMAESAAHGASYLSWPTWPEPERARMIKTILPQTEFLREHADLLNDVTPVEDVLVFLPMRAWLDNDQCPVSPLVAELTRRNVCYAVFCEDDFSLKAAGPPWCAKARVASEQPSGLHSGRSQNTCRIRAIRWKGCHC